VVGDLPRLVSAADVRGLLTQTMPGGGCTDCFYVGIVSWQAVLACVVAANTVHWSRSSLVAVALVEMEASLLNFH